MKNGGKDRYCLFRCILQEQWQLEWICYGKEFDSFHTLRNTIIYKKKKKKKKERGGGGGGGEETLKKGKKEIKKRK